MAAISPRETGSWRCSTRSSAGGLRHAFVPSARAMCCRPPRWSTRRTLRLVDQKRVVWQNRAQFLGLASEMMRRILVDHARRRKMAKRSGQWAKVTITDALAGSPAPSIDVLNLDEAMRRLAEFNPRKSHIAELRFFGGLSLEEASSVLDLSVATIERDWQAARAWLYAQMNGEKPSP